MALNPFPQFNLRASFDYIRALIADISRPWDSSEQDQSVGRMTLADIESDADVHGYVLPLAYLRSSLRLGADALSLFVQALALQLEPNLSTHVARALSLPRLVPGTSEGATLAVLQEMAKRAGYPCEVMPLRDPEHPIWRVPLLISSVPCGAQSGSLLSLPVHVPGHWLSSLVGHRCLSEELWPFVTRENSDLSLELCVLPDEWRETIAAVAAAFFSGWKDGFRLEDVHGDRLGMAQGIAVILAGAPGTGKTTLCRGLAQRTGRPLLRVDASQMLRSSRWSELLGVLFSEAQLYGEIICIEHAEALCGVDKPGESRLLELLHRHRVWVVMEAPNLGAVTRRVRGFALLQYEIPFPDIRARKLLWACQAPPRLRFGPDVDSALLSQRYPLTGLAIRNALSLTAIVTLDNDDDVPTGATQAQLELAAALSVREVETGGLLRDKPGKRTLDNLVLTPVVRTQIEEIRDAMLYRHHILQDWGIERGFQRGLGIICLFDGPSGTGKTHCAECLAGDVGLELMQVRSAQVTDKYVGESEKRLETIFEQSDPNRQIILFDEADGFFSKRTAVGKSGDRYSNMEINTLLQLMESYPGLVILTTNLKDQMDQAFERRITYKVTFEVPTETEREKIWRAIVPRELPLAEDVDFVRLAEDYPITGGGIKNAIIRAAYAASRVGRVGHHHLANAAEKEAMAAGILIQHHVESF